MFKEKYLTILTVNAGSMHCIVISKREIDYAWTYQCSVMMKIRGYLYISCNKFATTIVNVVNSGDYILSQSPENHFRPCRCSYCVNVQNFIHPHPHPPPRPNCWSPHGSNLKFPGINGKGFQSIHFKSFWCAYWVSTHIFGFRPSAHVLGTLLG